MKIKLWKIPSVDHFKKCMEYVLTKKGVFPAVLYALLDFIGHMFMLSAVIFILYGVVSTFSVGLSLALSTDIMGRGASEWAVVWSGCFSLVVCSLLAAFGLFWASSSLADDR